MKETSKEQRWLRLESIATDYEKKSCFWEKKSSDQFFTGSRKMERFFKRGVYFEYFLSNGDDNSRHHDNGK